jgi:hypothetical protein
MIEAIQPTPARNVLQAPAKLRTFDEEAYLHNLYLNSQINTAVYQVAYSRFRVIHIASYLHMV